MKDEEQAILDLTKENARLKREKRELQTEITSAHILLSKAGVPSSFEDGNDCDSLDLSERIEILAL